MRVPALAKHHGLTHDGYTYGHQEALYAGDKTSLAAFAADLALRTVPGTDIDWALRILKSMALDPIDD